MLLAYDETKGQLVECEVMIRDILRIPRVDTKIALILFMLDFQAMVQNTKSLVEVVDHALRILEGDHWKDLISVWNSLLKLNFSLSYQQRTF